MESKHLLNIMLKSSDSGSLFILGFKVYYRRFSKSTSYQVTCNVVMLYYRKSRDCIISALPSSLHLWKQFKVMLLTKAMVKAAAMLRTLDGVVV